MDNNKILIEAPCFFNIEAKELYCRSASNNFTKYDLKQCRELKEDDLLKVAQLNRLYLIYLCKKNQMNNVKFDGCLPVRCLDLNNNNNNNNNDDNEEEEELIISSKYLINCFIHLLKTILVQKDIINKDYDEIFIRDDKTVPIPTSSEKMRDMLNSTLKVFMEAEENKMEIDEHEHEQENDNDFANLNQLLKMIIGHVAELQQRTTKKVEKGKKKLNMVGGISQKCNLDNNNNNSDNNDISKMLTDCVNVIEKFIYDHRILFKDDDMVNRIINTMNTNTNGNGNGNSNYKIYTNDDISFQDMINFIGRVFNVFFFQTFPRYSMMLTIQGIMYYVSILNELKLINHFKDTIQLPILYKLIYSCFKDETSLYDANTNNWLKDSYPKIYKALNAYVTNTNTLDQSGAALEHLCNIALSLAISNDNNNNDLIDAVYWFLNHHLDSTIEFYLLIITNQYVQTKCSLMNKTNKISNAITFMKPLYNILTLFRNYVRQIGIDLALCNETLGNFSVLYANEIKRAINEFSLGCLKKKFTSQNI